MRRVMLVVALVVVLGAAVGVVRWWAVGHRGREAAGPAATAKLALNTVTMDPSTFAGLPYQPPKIAAEVQPYQVAADLSNVSNRKLLPKLTAAQRQALVRNAFVGRPTEEQQLFFVYENNTYKDIPSFITTDSVLQAYHIFYDFSLRSVEVKHLDKELRSMTAAMLAASVLLVGTAAFVHGGRWLAPVACAIALALLIVLYNAWHKNNKLAPMSFWMTKRPREITQKRISGPRCLRSGTLILPIFLVKTDNSSRFSLR